MNDLFQRRPWLSEPVVLPREPVGMLGAREARLFYFLAKEAFTGCGTVVDAGSFLGKSATYLASGLRANPAFDAKRDRVHCFDNFLVNEVETILFVEKRFHQQLAVGDSTRALFETQVADVRDLIEVHEGDFHVVPWQRQPIEILMVDIAKSESLNKRVAELFFSDLVPGRSIIIQQDYHHPWLPHIHVAMEFLAPWCEMVVPRCDDSAAFRLQQPIPAAALQRLVAHDFSATEQIELMQGAIERLAVGDRHFVELARVLLIGQLRGWTAARLEFASMEQRLGEFRSDPRFVNYLEGTRDTLDENEGWELKAKGDHVGVLRCADSLVEHGRIAGGALVMRGWAHRVAGRLDASEADLRRCLQQAVHSAYAYTELATTLMEQGRFEAAEHELVRCLFDDKAYPAAPRRQVLTLIGMAWLAEFRVDAVRRVIAELRDRLAGDPEVWVLDCRVHLRLGERAAGLSSLRCARSLGLSDARLVETLPDLGMTRTEWDAMLD